MQAQRLAATRQVNPRAYAKYLLGQEAAHAAAISSATRAMALDADLGDAYFARGVARLHDRWEFEAAYADFAAAESRLYLWIRRGPARGI